MAAIDKLYVHHYYEYDDLRRWAMVYYPKLLFYMRDISLSYREFLDNRECWVKEHKKIIQRELLKLGDYTDKNAAVLNLIKHYKKSVGYKCPVQQAIEEVDFILKEKEKMEGNDLEDDYTFCVMSTPLKVDRKLLWICPVPCVRKYLSKNCGYKTHWYHKLFFKGKKHFS